MQDGLVALCVATVFLIEAISERRRLMILGGVGGIASSYLWLANGADASPFDLQLLAILGLLFIFRALVVANALRRYDDAREYSLIRQDVQEPRGRPGAPGPGGGQHPAEQRLPGQSHRRDTGPHQDSSNPLRPPAAGRQPSGGHAPAGHRPAGRGARLKETVEQLQQANEDGGHSICHPGQTTT